MYFREFGIPARIAKCSSVEELEAQIKTYSGKKNCYSSVYVFGAEKDNGKTDYESAVINTIWFDFDDNKKIENCLRDVRKFYRKYAKMILIQKSLTIVLGISFFLQFLKASTQASCIL